MSAATQNEMERLRAERDEAMAERDALSAHVERLSDAVCKEGAGPMARAVIDSAPVDSLARLKAQWQAEALQQLADDYYGEINPRTVANRAAELRRQAEEPTNGHH